MTGQERHSPGHAFLRRAILFVVALGNFSFSRAETAPVRDVVAVYRDGLKSLVERADASVLFSSATARGVLLEPQRRDEVRAAWASFFDYLIALNALQEDHSGFSVKKSMAHARADFKIAYPAYLALYRWTLEFIDRAERNRQIPVLLNEPLPEAGLLAGSYDVVKREALKPSTATRFLSYESLAKSWIDTPSAAARDDAKALWKFGRARGPLLSAEHALTSVRKLGKTGWLPVQTNVANWMGDVKVARSGLTLISRDQAAALPQRLEPGDVLLERREWYLSNMGLPGFWTHAALYVGTPDERRAYFNDEGVRAWVRAQGEASGELERLLLQRAATAQHASAANGEGGPVRVLEAIGEGVVFTSIEHSAAADSLAALRPRRSKAEKAAALLRAFGYAGRPYDFDFDFVTDRALVCSELVYKAYQPSPGFAGVTLPLKTVLGRPLLPPNEIVRDLDENWKSPSRALDLVLFLDGQERAKRAVEADVAVFRRSWRRPKWHVFLPAENEMPVATQKTP